MPLLKRLFGRKTTGSEPEIRLFLETMLIMMAADGDIHENELAQFMHQIRIREEFQGISREDLDRHMQDARRAIKMENAEDRIRLIALGLPHHNQRLAAVCMSLSVALGNHELAPSEKVVLTMMRDAFGLTNADLELAMKTARAGNVEEVLDESASPIEQYYVETMMLMAAADGHLDGEELNRFGHQLAYQTEFEMITPEQVGTFMERSLKLLAEEGMHERLDQISAHLTDHQHRTTAFRLALEICLADGTADARERVLLKLLQEKFNLPDAVVQQEIDRFLGGRR